MKNKTHEVFEEDIIGDIERVDISKNYKNHLWREAQQIKRRIMFRNGQKRLTSFNIDVNNLTGFKSPVEPVRSSKSYQLKFTNGGENIMEAEPDLEGMEVTENPKGETLEGEITEVYKGERKEFVESVDDLPDWADADDEVIQVTAEVEYDGSTSTVIRTFAYYEKPNEDSNLGQFLKKYGQPPTSGMNVTLTFDQDGRGEIVY